MTRAIQLKYNRNLTESMLVLQLPFLMKMTSKIKAEFSAEVRVISICHVLIARHESPLNLFNFDLYQTKQKAKQLLMGYRTLFYLNSLGLRVPQAKAVLV